MMRARILTLSAAAVAVAAAGMTMSRAQQRRRRSRALTIPPALAREHESLHRQLAAAIAAGGRTGAAAREVEARLAPHFDEENRLALPALGVLTQLATRGASEEMRPAIEMAEHVEQNLDRFAEEHRLITEALDDLESAAEAEGNEDALRFVDELRAHAREAEDVLYPATILIGRYLQHELGER